MLLHTLSAGNLYQKKKKKMVQYIVTMNNTRISNIFNRTGDSLLITSKSIFERKTIDLFIQILLRNTLELSLLDHKRN